MSAATVGAGAMLSRIGVLAREDAMSLQRTPDGFPLTYWPSGHVGGMEDRANAALREARAILERHEPEDTGYVDKRKGHLASFYARRDFFPWDPVTRRTMTEALADAISAWIETPNPEGD